jgi:hypothetical protein
MTHADIEVLADPQHEKGFLGTLKASIDAFREKPAQLGELRFDPAQYSLTIIGTPVWAGKMSPAVRAYLQRFASRLDHVGLFVTSARTNASTLVQPVEKILGHEVRAFIGFDAADFAHAYPNDEKLAHFLSALQGSVTSFPVITAATG